MIASGPRMGPSILVKLTINMYMSNTVGAHYSDRIIGKHAYSSGNHHVSLKDDTQSLSKDF
jgi:hypothetical protein